MLSFSNRAYSKLFRILTRIGVAQRIVASAPVHVGNRRFRAPIVMTMGMGNVAMGDRWALEIFATLLPTCPGAFLDVGANVGQTLLKVKSCGRDRAWIGFEPNPNCVMYLERLIEANRFESCVIVPAALDIEAGVKALDCFEEDPADKTASIVKNFRPDHRVLRHRWVPVMDFSAITRAGIDQPIAFVKVDVEGGEKEVLESLHTVLEKYRPFVLLEILPVWSIENRERLARQQAVEAQLRGLGYVLCRVERTVDDRLAGLLPLAEIGVHDQLTWCDYLVIPSERLDETLAKFGPRVARPMISPKAKHA